MDDVTPETEETKPTEAQETDAGAAEEKPAEERLAEEERDADASDGSEEGAEAKAEEGDESQEAEEGEEGEGEEGDDTDEGAEAGGKHKRASGFKRTTARLRRLRSELEQERRERAMLMEQLQRLQPAASASAGKEKTAEEKAAEYLDALVEKRIAAREEEAAKRQRLVALEQKEQEFRATHEDYDDALGAFARSGVPPTHVQALLTSEHGHAIMYQLAKSQHELARFRALSALEAALEIGRLEAKLASGETQPKPKPAARPPAPPTKVGGSVSSTRSLEDLPISEYKRRMRSQGR